MFLVLAYCRLGDTLSLLTDGPSEEIIMQTGTILQYINRYIEQHYKKYGSISFAKLLPDMDSLYEAVNSTLSQDTLTALTGSTVKSDQVNYIQC